MDELIASSVATFNADLQLKCIIYTVAEDMVGKVERHALLNSCKRAEHDFACAQRLNDSLLEYIKYLEEKSAIFSADLARIKSNASLTRDSFVSDIGYFLQASRKTKETLVTLENRLAKVNVNDDGDISGIGEANEREQESVATVISAGSIAVSESSAGNILVVQDIVQIDQSVKRDVRGRIICHLEEALLLQVFSYLETAEVLNTAQTCRLVYKRVDGLFGTESAVVKQWDVVGLSSPIAPVLPPAAPALVPLPPAPSSAATVESRIGEVRWTKEMLESLTKKLNGESSLAVR
jgi:hypothetical protein